MNTCGPTESCDLQTGQCQCLAAYRRCGATCALCPTANVATTTCNGNQCVAATCTGAYRACNGTCTACPTSGVASTTCDGSNQCVAATCVAGSKVCAGACATCPANAATTTCGGPSAASCQAVTCSSGFNACGGTCVPDSDETQCGPSCTMCPREQSPNQTGLWSPVCRAGVCGQGCPQGQTLCKGVCQSGACTWSTTTVSTTARPVVSATSSANSSTGYLNYVEVGPPAYMYTKSFTRSGAVPTVTGNEMCTTDPSRLSLAGIASPPGSGGTGICPQSPDSYVYNWLGAGSSFYSVNSPESGTNVNLFGVDYTDNGLVLLGYTGSSYGIWSSWPVSLVTSFAPGATSLAAWPVSTTSTQRVAWVDNSGVLKIATKGTSSWSIATAAWQPSTPELMRSLPDGTLANIAFANDVLTVTFENTARPTASLTLPADAVYRAKFDFNGVFHVVSSSATRGSTQLHTLQGSVFSTELVSTTTFGAVDFTVLSDSQAAVVGAGPTVVLYR